VKYVVSVTLVAPIGIKKNGPTLGKNPSCSACYCSHTPNWKEIDLWTALNDLIVPGRLNIDTFGGDKPINGILIVFNKRLG